MKRQELEEDKNYVKFFKINNMKSFLNESQIERIADTVNKSNIASAELKEDLIDHLCCIAEDEMSKGKDFEVAYREVLQLFRPNELSEIQNGMVFLYTSRSRRRLNRALFASGLGALTGALATIVMKMLHLPFAQLVFIASVSVVLLVLVPVIFIRMFKQTPGKKRIPFFGFRRVLMHVGCIFMIVSAVFHICHWPGSIIILLLAIICGYIAVFPLFFFKIFKKSR